MDFAHTKTTIVKTYVYGSANERSADAELNLLHNRIRPADRVTQLNSIRRTTRRSVCGCSGFFAAAVARCGLHDCRTKLELNARSYDEPPQTNARAANKQSSPAQCDVPKADTHAAAKCSIQFPHWHSVRVGAVHMCELSAHKLKANPRNSSGTSRSMATTTQASDRRLGGPFSE